MRGRQYVCYANSKLHEQLAATMDRIRGGPLPPRAPLLLYIHKRKANHWSGQHLIFLSVLRDTEGFDAAGSIFASESSLSKCPVSILQRDKTTSSIIPAGSAAKDMEMCGRESEQSERGKCGIAQGRKRVCGSAFIPNIESSHWSRKCLFRRRAAL